MGRFLVWIGALVVLASIVGGIWLQTIHFPEGAGGGFSAQYRISLLFEALAPFTFGFVLMGVGVVVETLQRRDQTSG